VQNGDGDGDGGDVVAVPYAPSTRPQDKVGTAHCWNLGSGLDDSASRHAGVPILERGRTPEFGTQKHNRREKQRKMMVRKTSLMVETR